MGNHELGQSVASYIKTFQMVFWDFDGTIKDSVDVKTEAYGQLFHEFGNEFINQVKEHHEANGGMSRLQKIPHYLRQAGIPADIATVGKFCNTFSNLVMKKVIESPWIPGVVECLQGKNKNSIFVLVTATPTAEITEILARTGISSCFQGVFGAPAEKEDVIAEVLKMYSLRPDNALMIGDSEADLLAAQRNSISFLLRKTSINIELQTAYDGPRFEDFLGE